ncbi:phage head closure protein [Pseudoxanthomonas winnipegensis]|uniref:Head-tail adaptor protein n=1 Tax=Pseudoxanthomonas winnipegensis TaxID=2480810 RepID=A0A4V2HD25_9GAMM|nr:phage head closure protein [Pseudoxanthomonas winnipegensis]RZZ81401.1 head-tail adaptor protein [Pseudoxanthomonas winnipegensis]TAA25396.1 head-tail adaptor protein [Pseudoxanthomonas winnipegensis]
MSGKYPHRIDLLARGLQKDQFGDEVETWTTWAPSVPADVHPLSGREFIEAGADQAQLKARIQIPYKPGVESTMRVVHDGVEYGIQAVLPDPTARRHLTLMVSTEPDNA